MDNPSTHMDFDPDLWLEVGLFGESDKNQVYGLSITMAEYLGMARSVSTIGCSQSVLSTWSSEFTALLDQGVQEHMLHLNEKYKGLSVDYKELRRMVMDMRSQMGVTCAPAY